MDLRPGSGWGSQGQFRTDWRQFSKLLIPEILSSFFQFNEFKCVESVPSSGLDNSLWTETKFILIKTVEGANFTQNCPFVTIRTPESHRVTDNINL